MTTPRGRRWKMWALMPEGGGKYAFDVYYTERAALSVKAPYEKVVPVEVREITPRRRGRK